MRLSHSITFIIITAQAVALMVSGLTLLEVLACTLFDLIEKGTTANVLLSDTNMLALVYDHKKLSVSFSG